MLVAFVDEPLINLIAEAQSVVFNAEVSDHLQLISGENLQEQNRKYWKLNLTFLTRQVINCL